MVNLDFSEKERDVNCFAILSVQRHSVVLTVSTHNIYLTRNTCFAEPREQGGAPRAEPWRRLVLRMRLFAVLLCLL